MKTVKVYHYDAFSSIPNKGNPAGVVLNSNNLTDKDMQEIALKVGFNETAFPMDSDVADLKIRYFTPGHEMNLCGHATIATIFALKSQGLLDKERLTIETRAGILLVKISDDFLITMEQANPQFRAFNGSYEDLANSIGISMNDIDLELPTLYGNTGAWTLLIPIKNLEVFKNMKPINKRFPDILQEMPHASVHPFCLETYDKEAHMHARHFSSPYSGTIEDPVTGTASGVMGAYYAKYINKQISDSLRLVVEQGQEMDRDGRVIVKVTRLEESYGIKISGNAIYVKEFEVVI